MPHFDLAVVTGAWGEFRNEVALLEKLKRLRNSAEADSWVTAFRGARYHG